MSNAPKRRRSTVYLYEGDDLDELSQLRQAATDAKSVTDGFPRLASDPDEAVAAREAFNARLALAKGRATKVVVQALPRLDWRALVEANPPREVTEADDEGVETTEVDPRDATHGVNDETMPDQLLGYISEKKPGVRTIDPPVDQVVDPDGEPLRGQAELTEFLEELSDADFYRLYSVALMLNVVSADPKALPVFNATQTSDET